MFRLSKKKAILLCFVLAGIIYYLVLVSRPRRKASDLIRDVIDFSEYLEETRIQMKEFLIDPTYDNLVANHVKPAVDQIASIRKQTEIYESMQRIPGGPQNFMTTSLTVLEKIQSDLLEWESQYRVATARFGRVWTALSSRIDTCSSRLSYFDSDNFNDSLGELQIYFQPTDFEDPERGKRKPPEGTPLSRIISLMSSKLLPLVEKFEQIKITNNQAPYFQTSDIHDMKVLRVLEELMKHLTSYSPYYETVSVHWMDALTDLKKMTHQMSKIENSKTRYEDLAVGIDTDITSLQERIRRLKFPKKQPDEL